MCLIAALGWGILGLKSSIRALKPSSATAGIPLAAPITAIIAPSTRLALATAARTAISAVAAPLTRLAPRGAWARFVKLLALGAPCSRLNGGGVKAHYWSLKPALNRAQHSHVPARHERDRLA